MPTDLSVTLSTPHVQLSPRTLALALKDIVELARELHYSTSLKDFPDAQSIAAEIAESVDRIKGFCDEHYAALDDSVDAKEAIFDLQRNIKIAHQQCNNSLSAPSEGESRKPGTSLNVWKDGSKIEASFMQLRDRVNSHHTQITMFAGPEFTIRPLATIEPRTSSWVTDEKILKFIEFGSENLPNGSPSEITYNVADAYIRDQIDNIDKKLTELSSTWSYTVEKSAEVHYESSMPSYATRDGAALRQDVIVKISKVQELIRNDSVILSIRKGALQMIDLANALYSMDMFQEAAKTGSWTVNLFRTLVSSHPEVYSPYLSLSLQYLSLSYIKMDKLDEAESAIEEAVSISRPLHATSKELEVKTQIVAVLTTCAHVASSKKDYRRALEYAEEAVQIFELLMEETRPSDGSSDLQLIRTEEEWAGALVNFPDQAICDYSRALERLSQALRIHDRPADAIQAIVKASTIMNYMSRYHVDGELDPELAWMFYQLSHHQFRDNISCNEALEYSNKAVTIYRRLYGKNAQRYAELFCEALWEEGSALGTLERHEAALGIWTEAANAAKDASNEIYRAVYLEQLSHSFRPLKRYDEAVTTRTEAVNIYSAVPNPTTPALAIARSRIAQDLREADRFPEAIEMTEKALMQYRIFASKHPDEYTKYVVDGLNELIFALTIAGETEKAFKEGHEALKLHETLIVDNPALLPYYQRCLALNLLISLISGKGYEKKSFRCIAEVVHHSREVAQRFPAEPEESSIVIKAVRIQSMILSNIGDRIEEARAVLQEALDWYDTHPATSASQAEQHMDCLTGLRNLLDDQGYFEQALEPLAKAIEIGGPFSDDPEIASEIAHAMSLQTTSFLRLGMFNEFMKASEEAVAFARRPTVKAYHLAGCLIHQSEALKHTGRSVEALTVLNETLTILDLALEQCRGNIVAEATNGRACLEINLPECYTQLSDNMANIGRDFEALTTAQKAVDTVLGLRGKYVTVTWQTIEPLYIDCLYTLSLRLAANGKLSRALEIVVECRKYYKKRSKVRKGLLPQFASVMRLEAILRCASGRHVEGIVARWRFTRSLKRLHSDNPSLARFVKIELDLESGLASWSNLVAKLDLKCHHQDEDRAGLVNRLANRFKSLVHASGSEAA